MINIKLVNPNVAQKLCKEITNDLPEYFGLPEANENYFLEIINKVNYVAFLNEIPVGLISLEFPYSKNCNIYWLGILRDFHGKGIGKQLLQVASNYARENNAYSITVETLSSNEKDQNYLKTYNFYLTCGYHPMFNLKPLGYNHEMVYMVKNLFNNYEN